MPGYSKIRDSACRVAGSRGAPGRPHGDYQAQSLPPLRGLRRTSRARPSSFTSCFSVISRRKEPTGSTLSVTRSRSTTDRGIEPRPHTRTEEACRCCSCAILSSQGPHPTSSPIKVRSAWQLQNKGLGLPSGGQCAAPVGRPHGDYQAQSPPPLPGLRRTSRAWPEQVRDSLLGHLSPEGTDRIDLAGHPGSRSTTDPRNRAAPARPNRGSRRRGCSCAILTSKGRILLANRTVEECLATPIKGLGLLSGGQCAASVGRPHGDYQAQSPPPLRGLRRTSRAWPSSFASRFSVISRRKKLIRSTSSVTGSRSTTAK